MDQFLVQSVVLYTPKLHICACSNTQYTNVHHSFKLIKIIIITHQTFWKIFKYNTHLAEFCQTASNILKIFISRNWCGCLQTYLGTCLRNERQPFSRQLHRLFSLMDNLIYIYPVAQWLLILFHHHYIILFFLRIFSINVTINEKKCMINQHTTINTFNIITQSYFTIM